MNKKKIVGAKADKKGTITHVKIEGNQNFTPIKKAIELTERGIVDLVVVNPLVQRYICALAQMTQLAIIWMRWRATSSY